MDTNLGEKVHKIIDKIGENYEALNRNYYATVNNEINLDKNFVPIKINSTFIDKSLSLVEEASSKLHALRNLLSKSNTNSSTVEIISKVDNFVQSFASQKEEFDNFSHEERISKLNKSSILHDLRDAGTYKSDTLHTLLHHIIDYKYAIPKDEDDEVAFGALSTLYYGTQIYVAVLFFVVKQYVYLANYYYNIGDMDKYDHNFMWAEITFSDFKHSLSFRINNNPLIDEVINVFDKVTNKRFTVEEQTSKDLADKKKSLSNTVAELRKTTLPVLSERPVEIDALSLKKKGRVTGPIGPWKDGTKVSYAIQSTSNGVYSKIGNWYEPTRLGVQANPSLTIPVDPHRNTRMIFRRFDNKKAALVGVLTKASKTEFRDIHRDFYDAASGSDEDRSIEDAEIWLQNGADVSKVFEQGRGAWHAAAKSGNAKFAKKFLIGINSTSVNLRDVNGYTPLLVAAEAGQKGFIELLINNGADPNKKTFADKLTPLHIAAFKSHDGVIQALLTSSTIDINAKDNEGFTPLHNAVFAGVNVVNALISDDNINVNAKSRWGLTPLHLAAITNKRDVAEALVGSTKVDVNAKAEGDLSPLHFASVLASLDLVKYLTEQSKVNVNIKAIEKWTPLHLAAMKGNKEIISTLLDHGANIEAKTGDGLTPLALAKARRHTAIVNFLESKGAKRNRRDIEYYDDFYSNENPSFDSIYPNGGTDDLYSNETSHLDFIYPNEGTPGTWFINESFTSPDYPGMTSGSSKPSSWINTLSYTIINTVMGLSPFTYFSFAPAIDMKYLQPSKTVEVKNIEASSTLLLLDVFVRKFTGQSYISTTESSVSSIEAMGYTLPFMEAFEKILEQVAKESGTSLDYIDIDFIEIQKIVASKIISGNFSEVRRVLKSYVEKALVDMQLGCSDRNKFDKLIVAAFNIVIDSALNGALENIHGGNNLPQFVGIKEPQIMLQSKTSVTSTSACKLKLIN